MVRVIFVLVFATCLSPIVASTKLFPAIRKRLAQQKHTKAALLEQKGESVSVPAPVDVGADGFPKLPEVSQILGGATLALKTVNSQANAIEVRVMTAQSQIETKLAKQKIAFEANLKRQEATNLAVTGDNSNITYQIKVHKAANDRLRKHAHGLQHSNRMLRSELNTLESKLGLGVKFTAETLTKTDDSKEPKLAVLQMPSSALQVADDDDKEDADSVSLLQLSKNDVLALTDVSGTDNIIQNLEAQDATVDPGDLLKVLTKDVAHLQQQEKQSEKQLKDMFIRDFRAGVKRHMALMAQQKLEMVKLNEAHELQNTLQKAVKHLDGTHTQLNKRLHSLGQFVRKLAHLANAHEDEMPHLLEKLPKAI